MKVVIIGPAYPLRGGLATYNERLARAFQEAGDEVRLVTFSLQYPDFLFPGQTQFSTEPGPTDLDIEVSLNSVNPLSWYTVGNKLRRERPDLVIFRFWLPFMGPALGTVARLVQRNRHTRVVAITDNVIPHEKRPGDRPLTKYFLSACHGFVTMSRSVLADLRRLHFKQPAQYKPHPLYDNFGPLKPKAEALRGLGLSPEFGYLLFFGFIRAYKGLDILLEAFADERLAQLPVKLIIAGEYYEDAAPYEVLIAQHNLESRLIRATDFIPNEKVVDYFCAADLIVQPYKNATQSGVSQIAYHFERPMLVTDVGGLAELIPDGEVGYVVPPKPKAIADALVDFYQHQREAEFTAGVWAKKKEFSWEEMVKALKEVANVA
ncbi:Glycosyltransferase involved in cell wall bisynthesis [Hymenobacter gelipurpurascens]|uniref:Glycosyltransferase involved in cell wall bisynthesis n=1 Tax=Hymenobacter gelipurpurascens TaxID=89968 RepID=A0A212T0A7_9BACT|nr:glycosyltransferase [Hymenobacter gelipurpurascens]SNC59204.1 Glycosyltransferase involved in cell wall bisynthesis [Hymenobacter gelipurpurascens]